MATIETIKGTRDIGTRLATAELAFRALVQEVIGCTDAEAAKVFAVYRKARVLKLESGAVGRYVVNHGAFWDPDVLRRAVRS